MLLCRRGTLVRAMASATPVVLDKAAFKEVVQLPALRVPAQKCHELMRKMRGYVYGLPFLRFRCCSCMAKQSYLAASLAMATQPSNLQKAVITRMQADCLAPKACQKCGCTDNGATGSPPSFRFTYDRPKTKCIVLDGDKHESRLLLLQEGLQQAGGLQQRGCHKKSS